MELSVTDKQEARFVDAQGRIWPKLDPHKTGPFGRCPRCGQGHIFQGFLKIRAECEVCGLDYSFAEPADGPAFFVQMFTCIPAVLWILLLEIFASPPLWVHIVTGVPLLLITCVLPLRPLKGWLVASQFYFKAQEGRLVRE